MQESRGINGRGFTLSEVVIAFGLFAVVALTVIGLFTSLLKSSGKSSDQAAAELLAKSILDDATRAGPPNWGLDPAQTSRRLETKSRVSATDFEFQLDTVELEQRAHGTLFQLNVSVSWAASGAKISRQGEGKLWIEKERTVYIESL